MSRSALRYGTRGRAYLGISLLAVVAWGGVAILAPNAIYWDDWVLNNGHDVTFYSQLGLPWMGYVNSALLAIGPWAFKVLELVATIVAGYLAYLISGRGLRLPEWQRWLLAALVTVLPLNSERAAVAVLDTYTLSFAVFFAAWWLLVWKRPAAGEGWVRYLIAAVLLLASYTTASFLPFTIFPIAHLMYLSIGRDEPFFRAVLRFIGRFWYVLIAPFVFWVLKTLFLAPYGIYAGYNSFELISHPLTVAQAAAGAMLLVFIAGVVILFLRARFVAVRAGRGATVAMLVLGLMVCCIGVLLLLIREDTDPLDALVPVAVVVCGLVLVASAVVGAARTRGATPQVAMTAVGVIVLSVAMLPYLLVGKLPSFATFDTRSQLLMPVGVAIIVLAAIRSLGDVTGNRPARVIGLALTGIFVCASLLVSLHLVADWNKQQQVITALRHEQLPRDASTVVFSDRAKALGYDDREYSFYEITGWLETAYGGQTRLGFAQSDLPSYLKGTLLGVTKKDSSRYGYGRFHPSNDGVLVTISPTPGAAWLGLVFDAKSITLSVKHLDGLLPTR